MDQSEAATSVKIIAFWQGVPRSGPGSGPGSGPQPEPGSCSDLTISRRINSGLNAVLHNFRIPSTFIFSKDNSKIKYFCLNKLF